jgi:hypothetical protein
MKATEFLTERFFNAINTNDKTKYAQVIWDMIQRSYAEIGGIHGSGFNNIEDMINSNYMFKVGLSAGTPVMATIYKNKDGSRKKVAMGTDGSEEGLAMAKQTLKAELSTGRAYGEFSGAVFGAAKKLYPPDVLKPMLVPAANVAAMIGKRIEPGAGSDMRTTGANDPYEAYYYQRIIGGEMHTKVAYGDPVAARFYT